MSPECQLELSLFEHGVDTAQPVHPSVRHCVEAAERVIEIGQRLVNGPQTLRFLSGQYRVIDCLLSMVVMAKMKRQQFRDFFSAARIKLFERIPNDAVQGSAVPREQRAI